MAEIRQFRPKRNGNGHGNPPLSWFSRAVTMAFIIFVAVVLEAAGSGRISSLTMVVALVVATLAFILFAKRRTGRQQVRRETLH